VKVQNRRKLKELDPTNSILFAKSRNVVLVLANKLLLNKVLLKRLSKALSVLDVQREVVEFLDPDSLKVDVQA
jgi:hypothetical protein